MGMQALVIGADSGIGAVLSHAMRGAGWEVYGTSRRGTPGTLPLDLSNLPDQLDLPKVDVAFLCAAMTRQADCRANPEMARIVNVEAPGRLAERLSANGTQVQFLSTNAVFSGDEAIRDTHTLVAPVTFYGRQKADAERAVLAVERGVVLRLTKVLPPTLPLFVNWIAALRAGQVVQAFTDMVMAPVAMETVVAGMMQLAKHRCAGVFHASAPHDICYAEACRHLADRLGVSAELVHTTTAAAKGIPAAEVPAATALAGCASLEALLGEAFAAPLQTIDHVYGSLLEASKVGKSS